MSFAGRAALLVAAGAIAGVMNALAGGGTLVTFPALVFAGLPAIDANATSTVALLTGIASSIWGYRRELLTQKEWAVKFSIPSLLGGLAGALLLLHTKEAYFRAIIPYLILFATALFTFQGQLLRMLDLEGGTREHHLGFKAALLFQFAVSVYGGYFGAGIGILMLASLGILGFSDVHEMNSIKVTQAFLINIVAAACFVFSGRVHWMEVLLVACGSVLGGGAGPWLGRRVGTKVVRVFVSVLGFAIGLYFLLA